MSDRTKRHLLLATWVTLILAWATLPVPKRYDFCTYYVSGLLLMEGEPEKAFTEEGLRARHEELHFRRQNGAFLYSPLYLFPSAVLALLPFRGAEVANHAIALVSLGLLLFLLLQRSRSLILEGALCLVFLLSHVVSCQFDYQNWSFLLAVLVALGWHLTRKESKWGSAFSWAAAAHLKIYAGLFLVVLGVSGRRRVALRSLGVVVLLALLTLPFVGLASWQAMFDTLAEFAKDGVTPFHHKVSLQGTIARYLGHPGIWSNPEAGVRHPVLTWLLPVSLPIFLALVWRRRGDWEWAVAATIPYLLLFNPTTWDHSEILFLVVLPALPLRMALFLCALLCASWFYFDIVWWRFIGIVRDGHSGALAQAVLLFYPLLNLLALTSLLLQPRKGAADSDPKAVDGAPATIG